MAKSNAERQRELGARRSRMRIGPDMADRDGGEGEMRIDMWIRTSAFVALWNAEERAVIESWLRGIEYNRLEQHVNPECSRMVAAK
jgi:hypothetical protein